MPGNYQLVSGYSRRLLRTGPVQPHLSADFTYNLLAWLSVGTKYGVRFGEVSTPHP